MAEAISGIAGNYYDGIPVIQPATAREKVQQEFMAIYYKEILKQAFKTSDFSLDKENASFFQTFGKDLLVEQMAMELARSKAYSAQNIFPSTFKKDGAQ